MSIERNGEIKPPKPNSECGKAWAVHTVAHLMGITDPKSIVAMGVTLGLNAGNMKIEGSHWRAYHNKSLPTDQIFGETSIRKATSKATPKPTRKTKEAA